jgi:hypothetical protein
MPAQAEKGRRLALIIAGSRYSDPTLQQLRAPGKDASDLAEVLRDPAIGGFAVETLIDAPADQVKRGIFDFCDQADPGDLLLFYLSCHGLLDDRGRLYYATTDTERRLLGLTAVPAEWLNEQLEDCRARREILILDCCHSGAFAKGSKGGNALALQERFGGRGKIVLTASGATEYSFEGNTAVGDDVRSVFTHSVVEGLRSGVADLDGDGLVSVDDLYDYVYGEVRAAEPRQTPKKWVYGAEGELVVARSVRGATIEPVPLPEDLAVTLESPRMLVRETGVKVLAELLVQGPPGLAVTARQKLQQISEEDLPKIAEQARTALLANPGPAVARRDAKEQTVRETTDTAGRRGDPLPVITSTPPPSPQGQVALTLLVGLRPALGQSSEDMELLLDGQPVTRWRADRANPSQLIQLEVGPTSRKEYQLKGTYEAQDAFGNILRGLVKGAGVINVMDGARFGILYDQATDTFSLQPLP